MARTQVIDPLEGDLADAAAAALYQEQLRVAQAGDVPPLHVLAPAVINVEVGAAEAAATDALVYTPGQQLPQWLAQALLDGRLTFSPDGSLTLKATP